MAERYTFARAFAGDADARNAWQLASRDAKARPQDIGVVRVMTPDGLQAVIVVAPGRPAGARSLERLLTLAPGSLPLTLDSGAADALHAHWAAQRPPGLPPGAVARIERLRPTAADGLPLPYAPAGRPEPAAAEDISGKCDL